LSYLILIEWKCDYRKSINADQQMTNVLRTGKKNCTKHANLCPQQIIGIYHRQIELLQIGIHGQYGEQLIDDARKYIGNAKRYKDGKE